MITQLIDDLCDILQCNVNEVMKFEDSNDN